MADKMTVTHWCEDHQQRCPFGVIETHQWLERGLDGVEWAQARPGRISWEIDATDSLGMAARRGGAIDPRCTKRMKNGYALDSDRED